MAGIVLWASRGRPIRWGKDGTSPRWNEALIVEQSLLMMNAWRSDTPMYTHRLGRYPQTIVAFYGVEEGLPSGSIHGLAVDADGSVWAATEGGLAVWDGNTWCAPKGAGALPEGHARQVFVSRQGEVWATVAGALFRYDQGAWV